MIRNNLMNITCVFNKNLLCKFLLAVIILLVFASPVIAENNTMHLFDRVNTTVLVNNTALYDLNTYVECNYIDPEDQQVIARSSCELIQKNSKKEYISQLILTKPGEWKIHSCVVYGSLQDMCENAVPQHVYRFDPLLTVNAEPKPNSVEIINPADNDALKGIAEIAAVVAGDYEKLEFGYGQSCDSAQKRLVNFSSIPVAFNWNTTAVEDNTYKICLFLSGYGFESNAARTVKIENYNFTLNPIKAYNQSALAGQSIDYTFMIKNTGGVSDNFKLSTGTDALVGTWNAKMFTESSANEIKEIVLAPNEEKNIIIKLDVPFISMGSDALLKLTAANSKNEEIEISQRIVITGRIQRVPIISDITYPDPADQGFEAYFTAKITDPDQDAIIGAKACLDENCTKALCDLNYDAGQDLYACNSEGLSSLIVGDHKLFFIATDSTKTKVVQEKILRIAKPESVNILTPYLGEHVSGNVVVKADLYVRGSPAALFGIGTDASCAAVSYNQMRKDPSTSGTYVYSWNTELIDDGKYFVCVKAVEDGQERIGSRLIYVDNYRFEINPIYRSLSIGSSIDLDYALKNNGRKTSFEISANISNDYQLLGLTIAGRLVEKETVVELGRGEKVNISAKIIAKPNAQANDFFLTIKSKDVIKSTARLNPAASTNREPYILNLAQNPDIVDAGSILKITADDISDKENDFISQKEACRDFECSEKMCILELQDNKLGCSYNVKQESGLHRYFVALKDDRNNRIVYMKEYSSRERIEEPVCGGTTTTGFFECRQYSECSDKEFPPPCYTANALGTDGCLRGKVCCKLDQKPCTSTTGCNNKIVSKSCIYDAGTDTFNVFTGVDWYGGTWSDVFAGTKKSQRYDSYSYIDSETLSQDGVIRITSNVYGIDNSLYCSNESYVYCYRSDKPVPLTGIEFMHPVEAGFVKGIVSVEVGLNGLGIASLAVSGKKDCADARFDPMFCTGNVCKLNWDTANLDDKGYYLCARAEADRIITKSVFVNVKNYDFAVNNLISTNYVTANDIFQYPLYIKNTGGKQDTFVITISSDKWNASLSKTIINLAPGESESVNIVSSVPNIFEGQTMIAKAKIMSSKKTIETENSFIVKNNNNYAPLIKHVADVEAKEKGEEIVFNALIADSEGDKITANACKDSNCSQIYCAMKTDDNERYYCSYDTFDDYTGSHKFFVYASDFEKHSVASEYAFNVKENAPLITPVNITINNPVSTMTIKGIMTAEVNAIGTDNIEMAYSKDNRKCADAEWKQMQCTSGVCTLRLDTSAMDDDAYYFCARYKHIIESVNPVYAKNFNFRIDPVFSTSGLKAGAVNQIGYNIKNIGSLQDRYIIKAEIDKNWEVSIEPSEISLAEDKNANILIGLNVPAGIINVSASFTISATSQKTGKVMRSRSNMTVTERSYSHPDVFVSALPALVEEGSMITFAAQISDPEADPIAQKDICLDEFCNKLLCALIEQNNGYECAYAADIEPGTHEYYAVVKDGTGQVSKTIETFDVKKKKIIITNPYANITIPEQSSRTADRLMIKSATALSSESLNPVENLIDGVQGTYWMTTESSQSVIADLGELKEIDGIGIYSVYARPVDIKISLSTNCLDFYPLTAESNIAYSKNWHLEQFQKKDARCIELLAERSELNATTIGELEIYRAKAVVIEEPMPFAVQDYTLYIIIAVIAAAIAVVVLLRERIIEGFRNFSLWMKYR